MLNALAPSTGSSYLSRALQRSFHWINCSIHGKLIGRVWRIYAWRQAINWTNAGKLLLWHLGTNSSEIVIEIHTFSVKYKSLKLSSVNWRPFCLGFNVLTGAYVPCVFFNTAQSFVPVHQQTHCWLQIYAAIIIRPLYINLPWLNKTNQYT